MTVALGACGGDDFGAAPSAAQVQAYCEADCAYAVACDDPTPVLAECISGCVDGTKREAVAGGALDFLGACVGDLTCADNRNTCIDQLPAQDYTADLIAACTSYTTRWSMTRCSENSTPAWPNTTIIKPVYSRRNTLRKENGSGGLRH